MSVWQMCSWDGRSRGIQGAGSAEINLRNLRNREQGDRKNRAMHNRRGMGSLEVSGLLYSEVGCLWDTLTLSNQIEALLWDFNATAYVYGGFYKKHITIPLK